MGIDLATDEDIAIRAPSDFASLCPVDQKLAAGTNGFFDGSDRWTLRSSGTSFVGLGIGPGQVVNLFGPNPAFPESGETFGVVSVSAGGVTLRRKGMVSGAGQPPVGAGGLTGVWFSVPTLGAQISMASAELGQRFGIDNQVAGRGVADLVNPDVLREAVVLMVLVRRYWDLASPGGKTDPMANKAEAYQAALDDVLGRIVLRWRGPIEGQDPAPNKFGTRVVR
jgi:hypothetical protein